MMVNEVVLKRKNLGITLPRPLLLQIDRLRAPGSRDKELAGRDRSAAIEILVLRGMKGKR